jgi:hypothetical protein
MSKCTPFAQESREQITKSAINQSTSKTLWSFSKDRRFSERKPVCPYVSYLNNLSTINPRKTGFGSAKRRVFSEVTEVPSSWAYHPQKERVPQIPLFGDSRDVPLQLFSTALPVPTSTLIPKTCRDPGGTLQATKNDLKPTPCDPRRPTTAIVPF